MYSVLTLKHLLNKRVLAIRGVKVRKNAKTVSAKYILFDDEKTFIEIEEQDYHSYHDCDPLSKLYNVMENASIWQEIMNDNPRYGDANYF